MGSTLAAQQGEDRAPVKYSSRFLCFIGVYVLLIGTLNLLVDANNTFPTFHIEALDKQRHWDSRVATAHGVWREDIDVAVLGSSRPRAAFHGAQDLFGDRNFFNAALPNTSLRETETVAQLLFQRSSPKLLILGAEFDVYNYDHLVDEHGKSLFSPEQKLLEVYAEQLLSTYAAKKSLEVLTSHREQKQAPPYRTRFERLIENATRLAITLPPPTHYPPETYARLRRILKIAEREKTQVIIVLMPVHASLLTVYDELGIWPHFENWKHDLLTAASGDATVLDFSGYSEKNEERIPLAGSPKEMKWFTDPSHCSQEYGRAILKLVQDQTSADAPLLTLESLAKENQQARLEQARYRAENPNDVAWVASIIETYKSKAGVK